MIKDMIQDGGRVKGLPDSITITLSGLFHSSVSGADGQQSGSGYGNSNASMTIPTMHVYKRYSGSGSVAAYDDNGNRISISGGNIENAQYIVLSLGTTYSDSYSATYRRPSLDASGSVSITLYKN